MSHPKRKCKEEEEKKDIKEVERSSASPRVDIESLTKELEEKSERADKYLVCSVFPLNLKIIKKGLKKKKLNGLNLQMRV